MFSRQGVSRWSFQVTAKFISLLTYRLLGYICLSITANVCAIYWMTRKWSWRHRKFHKIRYIGFLKKLTRCEYELSRPSRSWETAADVNFHFSQIFKNLFYVCFDFSVSRRVISTDSKVHKSMSKWLYLKVFDFLPALLRKFTKISICQLSNSRFFD